MDNGSLAIGLGIGVIMGFALGVSITISFWKPAATTTVKEDVGVMYTYDDHSRLQSIIPVGKKIA